MTIQTVAAAMPAMPQELLESQATENARREHSEAYRSDWNGSNRGAAATAWISQASRPHRYPSRPWPIGHKPAISVG